MAGASPPRFLSTFKLRTPLPCNSNQIEHGDQDGMYGWTWGLPKVPLHLVLKMYGHQAKGAEHFHIHINTWLNISYTIVINMVSNYMNQSCLAR